MSWGRPYTEAEDFLILDTPHLTAAQVGAMIGRTGRSVEGRRNRLRGQEGITTYRPAPGTSKGRHNAKPWMIGSRTLIAKTCTVCGLLLDESWYRRDKKRIAIGRCRKCESIRQNNENRRKLHAIAAERATRRFVEYTDADLVILSDPDKSLFQMALETSRTLDGVSTARVKFGLADQKARLGDPAEAQWIIQLAQPLAS